MTTGQRIKMKRKELGMNQTELANLVGFNSKTTISKIERDERNLSQSAIMRIAKALGVRPSWLLCWDDKPVELDPDKAEKHAWLIAAYEQLTEVDKITVETLITRLLMK